MFTKAKNNRFKNTSFTINTTSFHAVPGRALSILCSNVAPNAILNAGGRADEVRCHPGTREEVIGLINKWRLDIVNNVAPNQIFWLSGPAGAGKSAIVQTVAETWKSEGIHTANFFFFRTDPSRSHARSFVSTLLYQIFDFFPAAREAVDRVLSLKPRILEAGLEEQVDELILATFRSIESPFPHPIILLIDGLDECDSETKTSQKQVLQALDKLACQEDLPFLILVASRRETHISAAFRLLTSEAQSVFLDDQYSPEKDIWLFVEAEFAKIKMTHPHSALLHNDWPPAPSVDTIVWKSSGQFIYAATVMRFLAQSSAVPSVSLEKVQGIVPSGKNSPFVHLDAFYTYILQQADDHKAILDILSAATLDNATTQPIFRPHLLSSSPVPRVELVADSNEELFHMLPPVVDFLQLYDSRYTESMIISCISDISSIVNIIKGRITFYHASLSDFLLDPARSDVFHVDINEFTTNILPQVWSHSLTAINGFTLPLGMFLLGHVRRPTPEITDTLLTVTAYPLHCDRFDRYFMYTEFLRNISRLYYPHQLKSYKKILKHWITWAVIVLHADQDQVWIDIYCGPETPFTIPLLKRYLLTAKMQKWVKRVADVFKFRSL